MSIVTGVTDAIKATCLVVLVGTATPAVAEDLIGPLQSELILYEGTMQAIENDASLCDGLVEELVLKINRSASASEKATLKNYLKTAKRCAAKIGQVVRDGASLHGRCSDVLDALRAVDDAPFGSNAARRAGSVRKAAGGCIAGFSKWNGQVEELKVFLNKAVEITRAT